MKRTYVFTLPALVLCFILTSNRAEAASAPPHIFYSDLQSGPASGGQNNQGVFVTIVGTGFGATQGNSQVMLAGTPAAAYPYWSSTRIVFQVSANSRSGNISVTVGGSKSNGIRFNLRNGNIYFVSPNGTDTGNGSFSAPWQTLTHTRDMLRAGDTVYLMDGLQQTGLDSNNASLSLATSSSGGNGPIALVAYPGANATIGSAGGSTYGIYAAKSSNWVISGLHILGANEAVHLASSGSWRIVGNDMSCPNASSVGGCLDGVSSGNAKVYGNTIHDSGMAGAALAQYDALVFTDSNGLDIGWNEVARTNACDAIHV